MSTTRQNDSKIQNRSTTPTSVVLGVGRNSEAPAEGRERREEVNSQEHQDHQAGTASETPHLVGDTKGTQMRDNKNGEKVAKATTTKFIETPVSEETDTERPARWAREAEENAIRAEALIAQIGALFAQYRALDTIPLPGTHDSVSSATSEGIYALTDELPEPNPTLDITDYEPVGRILFPEDKIDVGSSHLAFQIARIFVRTAHAHNYGHSFLAACALAVHRVGYEKPVYLQQVEASDVTAHVVAEE